MNRLPDGFDPTVFAGRSVESVCFSANNIYVFFDADVSIRLEGTFSISTGVPLESPIHAIPVASSDLMVLAGKTVVEASVEEGRHLRLEFTGGVVLVCRDDSTAYESYLIKIGDREVVV